MGQAVHAQSVHWQNGDSSLGNSVQLVFQDCQPDGDPQLPTIPDASLTYAGQSQRVNVVNFNITRMLALTYLVQSRGSSPLRIPAFAVKTNKGEMRVPAFNASAPVTSTGSVASSRLMPERNTVWAGQVFDLTYQLLAAERNNPQVTPTFDWSPAPLLAEDWSKPKGTETVVNGDRDFQVTYHTRAYARNAGTIKLHQATQLIQVQTGSIGFGLFAQAQVEPISVTSDAPEVVVRPLPAPPAGFSGAVGQFKFTSKVVPERVSVGEPVTWTLVLSGTGNWPDISGLPSREVSKDFDVVQPKAKRVNASGKLFDVTLTEDVVLVPTKPGTYSLEGVKFVYFDPSDGTFKTVGTESVPITITPPPAPKFAPPAAATSSAATNSANPESAAARAVKPVEAPALPAGIPRDPLPGMTAAAVPLAPGAFVAWIVGPFGALLVFWFILASRRAAQTDPARWRREARARLARLLAEFRSQSLSGVQPSPAGLVQWQRESAQLWQVPHSAPSASAFSDEWASLWTDVDRALYGKNTPLPSDWLARAEAALEQKKVPGFRPTRLFLPRNLLPFAAALMLVAGVVRSVSRAASLSGHAQSEPGTPLDAYRKGDFAAAEKAWRNRIAAAPTDWIARHNLALALAQQDESGEAAAQAVAAFVQRPNNASVRWHFALMCEKAGFVPPPLAPFLKEGPVSAIAALSGPARWQRILIATAFALAASLAWMLWNAYGSRGKVQYLAALVACAWAGIVGITAGFGYGAYGMTRDIRAVVASQDGTLRSIPTEADTSQKTTVLEAGTLAVVDKTFLGWDHLAFENGEAGWVRDENVVPLWR